MAETWPLNLLGVRCWYRFFFFLTWRTGGPHSTSPNYNTGLGTTPKCRDTSQVMPGLQTTDKAGTLSSDRTGSNLALLPWTDLLFLLNGRCTPLLRCCPSESLSDGPPAAWSNIVETDKIPEVLGCCSEDGTLMMNMFPAPTGCLELLPNLIGWHPSWGSCKSWEGKTSRSPKPDSWATRPQRTWSSMIENLQRLTNFHYFWKSKKAQLSEEKGLSEDLADFECQTLRLDREAS